MPLLPTPPPSPPPVIGISGASGDSKSVAAAFAQVQAAGAVPVLFSDHAQRNPNTDLARVDGLIILGNNEDIDPAKYGQARHPATKVETNLARAQYEETIISQALERGVPLLGICGGMQRLNTLKDKDPSVQPGTLEQHVPDRVGDDRHAQAEVPPFIPVQYVQLAPGSRLLQLNAGAPGLYTPQHIALPSTIVMENSMHHQAVQRVRSDFQVAATSTDATVEAIEPKPESKYGKQFVLGVQWHPEFGASALGPKIMQGLVGSARAYAQAHPHAVFNAIEAIQESALSSSPQILASPGKSAQDWRGYVQSRREAALLPPTASRA